MIATAGIHHVTGIAGDTQQNVDFYAGVLGLRLVKVTVNLDDPHTHHLYYGDGAGSPGTIITFFPWPRAKTGRAGVGQVAVTSFAIPRAAIGFWLERLVKHGVPHEGPTRRFGEAVITLRDRDGLQLELIARESVAPSVVAVDGTVPPESAIRGLHGVTLWEDTIPDTERVLNEGFGFERIATEDQVTRFSVPGNGAGAVVDVRAVGGFLKGAGGAGTIHHVAFRAADGDRQLRMREQLIALGLHPTDVLDRRYFESVYAREQGGVLFEIATDAPGFAIDEPLELLGHSLQLPAQFEADREAIAARLPAIHPPLSPPIFQPAAPLGTQS